MKVSNFCNRIYTYINGDKTLKFEKTAFLFFTFTVILVSCFHEPWFDEFQAWGISKDSLYNILFVIPHYEGHPPLWHLIIKCFSVFNINPELCLKIPNTIFITLSVWLIIFKSPFPRIIRLLLPFTYFILYQYGVICRPYSLFLLLFMLCAMFFDTRKTNPFRYVCLLAIFSMSSAYALIISTGIAIAWGFELIDWNNTKQSFKNLLKNKQFHALLSLFIFSILLCISIYPNNQNTAASILRFLPTWQKLLYCFCGIISDATMFDIIEEHSCISNLFLDYISAVYCLLAVVLGFLINIFIIKIFKKTNTLLFFIVPYLLLITVFFICYYWPHHSGLILFLLIFCFWISYNKLLSVITKKELLILKVLTASIIIVQLSWSAVSCIGDIFINYECSREIAQYIKKHKLYNYKIFIGIENFHYYIDNNNQPIFNSYIINAIDKKNDSNFTKMPKDIQNLYLPVILIPYFDKNIFYNFNMDFPDKFYALHIKNTDTYQQELIQKWNKKSLPDIIIDNVKLGLIWKNVDINNYYILLKQFNKNYLWKGTIIINDNVVPLYMKKSLFEKLNTNLSPKERFYYFSH